MKNPIISVIIPVYNTESYLRQCADSVINQSLKDIEIIFVNDGSTDNCLDILSDYAAKDSRVVVIDQNNQGVSAARNSGIKASKGEYIMFVDSDDWIEIDTCEKALSAAEAASADIVIWTYLGEFASYSRLTELFDMKPRTWSGSDKTALFCQIVGPSGKRIKHPEKLDNLSTVWNKLYKKEKVAQEEFVDTKIIGSEDYLYNVAAFYYADTVTFIPEALYHYRCGNPASLTHGYPNGFAEKWSKMFQMADSFIQKNSPSAENITALRNRICFSYIGISMRVISASNLTVAEKHRMLKHIRKMPTYDDAFTKWRMPGLPLHWKAFFFCVKHRLYFPVYLMCRAMHEIMQIARRK